MTRLTHGCGRVARYSLGNLLRFVPLHASLVVVFLGGSSRPLCPAVLGLMTMTNAGVCGRKVRVAVSPGGRSQDSTQGLPRRRATARLQAAPLLSRASVRLAFPRPGPHVCKPPVMTKRVANEWTKERLARDWRMIPRIVKGSSVGAPGGSLSASPPAGIEVWGAPHT